MISAPGTSVPTFVDYRSLHFCRYTNFDAAIIKSLKLDLTILKPATEVSLEHPTV